LGFYRLLKFSLLAFSKNGMAAILPLLSYNDTLEEISVAIEYDALTALSYQFLVQMPYL
jgi:hypothetical protein